MAAPPRPLRGHPSSKRRGKCMQEILGEKGEKEGVEPQRNTPLLS
jgi:hypothetical protein